MLQDSGDEMEERGKGAWRDVRKCKESATKKNVEKID